MKRGSLHTRRFRRIHLFLFRYKLIKNGFAGPKRFPGLFNSRTGARFSKVPKLYGLEKPFVKLRPAYSVKLVFWYVVQGIKIKITAMFRVSERLRFEVVKRIISPEKFRDFRETGPRARKRQLITFLLIYSLWLTKSNPGRRDGWKSIWWRRMSSSVSNYLSSSLFG